MIGVNYNCVVKELHSHFSPKNASAILLLPGYNNSQFIACTERKKMLVWSRIQVLRDLFSLPEMSDQNTLALMKSAPRNRYEIVRVIEFAKREGIPFTSAWKFK